MEKKEEKNQRFGFNFVKIEEIYSPILKKKNPELFPRRFPTAKLKEEDSPNAEPTKTINFRISPFDDYKSEP